MWYNRRTLIKTAALLCSGLAQPALARLAKVKTPTVTMKVVTTFPSPMSLEDWQLKKLELVDPRFGQLFTEMFHQNEILAEKHSFHHTYAVWQVEFRDLLASEKWIREVEKLNLVKNKLCKELNYKIESYLS